MLDALLERYRNHDRQALSRLLTLVARGEHVAEILQGSSSAPRTTVTPQSRVVAVTGSAGVGKSTLIGRLIELLRRRGLTVAVLACDPQSPVSGGALLGDRFRMPTHPDDGVFIRSLSAEGGHGAVANRLDDLIRVLEGFGFDVILIETVGAGQGDTVVRQLADAVLLLIQHETGDDLQWEKAGVLEIADVVAVHKADLPGSERTEAQVRAMLGLASEKIVPVLRVSAKSGEGLEQLWDLLLAIPQRRRGVQDSIGALLQRTQDELAARFAGAASSPPVADLVAQWRAGTLSDDEAVRQLLQLLAGTNSAGPRARAGRME